MREAYPNELYHHGILGMRWGVRRYQTLSGALTRAGRERYRQAKNDRIYSHKQQQLALKEEKERYKQMKAENRLENKRARLENKSADIENQHQKIENLDYLTAIKRGKSTKSYRDPRDGKPADTKSNNQNNGGNNQNNGGNNQNQGNPVVNSITARDLNSIDYRQFSNNDLQNLVNRIGNEQKLDEMYKKSIPPSKAEKASDFILKNGEKLNTALKIVAGIGASAIAIYGLKAGKAKHDAALSGARKIVSENSGKMADAGKKVASAAGNFDAKDIADALKPFKDAAKTAGAKADVDSVADLLKDILLKKS